MTIDDNGQAWIGKTRYNVIHLAAEHYEHVDVLTSQDDGTRELETAGGDR